MVLDSAVAEQIDEHHLIQSFVSRERHVLQYTTVVSWISWDALPFETAFYRVMFIEQETIGKRLMDLLKGDAVNLYADGKLN